MNGIGVIEPAHPGKSPSGEVKGPHASELLARLAELKKSVLATPENQSLAKHPDNLSYAYYRNLQYWSNSWRDQNTDILRRLDLAVRCDCPPFILDLVRTLRHQLQTRPRVLDFGCGPFSNLCYLHKKQIATVVGADILAEDYLNLYEDWQLAPPIPLINAAGENLSPETLGGHFDFSYVQNALDHTEAPALTWLNLFRATKVGGYLGHCHAFDETEQGKPDPLHPFNLRPGTRSELVLHDGTGHVFSLTKGLSLEPHFETQIAIRPGFSYFIQIWKKTGEAVEANFQADVLENLRRAFLKRSKWAFTMEDQFLRKSRLMESNLPYALIQNKPEGSLSFTPILSAAGAVAPAALDATGTLAEPPATEPAAESAIDRSEYHAERRRRIAAVANAVSSMAIQGNDYEPVLTFLLDRGVPEHHLREGSVPVKSLEFIRDQAIVPLGSARPLRALHIGNFVGVSLAYLAATLVKSHPSSIMISVDPNLTHRGIANPQAHVSALLSACGLSKNVMIVAGYSGHKSISNDGVVFGTYDPAEEFASEFACEESLENIHQLCPGTFDFIFLDGNHDATYLLAELKRVRPLLRPGGFVILDDVDEYWVEIRNVFQEIKSLGLDPVGADGRVGIARFNGESEAS